MKDADSRFYLQQLMADLVDCDVEVPLTMAPFFMKMAVGTSDDLTFLCACRVLLCCIPRDEEEFKTIKETLQGHPNIVEDGSKTHRLQLLCKQIE